MVSGVPRLLARAIPRAEAVGESVPVIHAAKLFAGVVARRGQRRAAEALNGWDTEIVGDAPSRSWVDAQSGTAKPKLQPLIQRNLVPVVSGREGFCGARN